MTIHPQLPAEMVASIEAAIAQLPAGHVLACLDGEVVAVTDEWARDFLAGCQAADPASMTWPRRRGSTGFIVRNGSTVTIVEVYDARQCGRAAHFVHWMDEELACHPSPTTFGGVTDFASWLWTYAERDRFDSRGIDELGVACTQFEKWVAAVHHRVAIALLQWGPTRTPKQILAGDDKRIRALTARARPHLNHVGRKALRALVKESKTHGFN